MPEKTLPEPEKTPQEQTKEFESELKRDEASAVADAKRLDGLREDLAALQTALSDLESASAAYEKGWKDLKKRKTDLEGFHSLQKERFKGFPKAEEVDRKVSDFEERIHGRGEEISELSQKLATAAANAEEAGKELTEAQADFNRTKEKQTGLENTLKEAEDLKGSLDQQGSDPKGYFILKELERTLREVQVETKDGFKDSFEAAFQRFKEAMPASRKATAELEKLKAELEKAEGELRDLKETRRTKILNNLPAK